MPHTTSEYIVYYLAVSCLHSNDDPGIARQLAGYSPWRTAKTSCAVTYFVEGWDISSHDNSREDLDVISIRLVIDPNVRRYIPPIQVQIVQIRVVQDY